MTTRNTETEAPMPAHVIDFIDEELEARGWSRRDLAERMGLDPGRLARKESVSRSHGEKRIRG